MESVSKPRCRPGGCGLHAGRQAAVRGAARQLARHHPRIQCSASNKVDAVVTTSGDGGSPPPSIPSNGNGGGGDGDGGFGGADVSMILAAAGKSMDSLPVDMLTAYRANQLTGPAVQRWLNLESNWFFKIFMPIQGFRERLMADPSFFVKVGIECGIGIATKCTAEYKKREGSFYKELDFVTANVIMAIIADFMLVWLPAPTMSFQAAMSCQKPSSALAKFFACCPDNAFQKVPQGFPPWTVAQRLAAPVRNGAKLLGVGFAASMLGVGITNVLIFIRTMLDGSFQSQNPPQNPLVVSGAYAAYMASSSNIRYQVLAGVIEERGIETFFKGNSSLCHACSFVLRTANTYLGSLMWVDFIRLLKLQPKSEDVAKAKAA